MKKAERILTIFAIIMFLFSIFNIGRVFASSDTLKITDVSISETSANVEASISKFDDDSISSNITYHKLNDYVVYKVTLKNVDDEKHIIDLIVDNNTSSNLEYEYKSYKNTILEPGDSIDVYIKEIYRKENTDLTDRSKKNNLKFTFNLIDDEKDETIIEKIIDIIVNPETGDNINYFFIIAGASIIALTILVIKNKNKTGVKLFGTILIITLLSIPILTKALESKDSISFENNINFQDKFKITYSYNDKTKEILVDYNDKLERIKDPTKDGYTFEGWYNQNTLFDFETKITSDLNLTAKFKKNTYTITFNLDEGVTYNPSEFKVSELPIKLNNPYKLGYTFTGWTGSNGDTPNNNIIINTVDDNLEYTANFSLINYEIKYIGLNSEEEAALNNPTTYTTEDTFTLNNPSNIVDANNEIVYKFVGWKDENGVISSTVTINKETGNKTYEPIWQKLKSDSFTITYNLPAGAYFIGDPNLDEFKSDTETFTLNEPLLDGYTFTGWTGSNGNVPEKNVKVHKGTTESLEFTANFEIINYDIHYVLNDGTLSSTNPNTYTYNDTFTLNNPSKRGYHFDGWTGTGLTDPSNTVTIPIHSTGERTYTANFTIEEYDIGYTLNGGSLENPNPLKYKVTDTVTLNNPTKEGYTFDGWTGSNGNTPSDNVSFTDEVGDKAYTANFTANTYTVEFIKNGADVAGNMADQEFTYDENQNLTENAYTKEGYEFMGWTTNEDGSGTLYQDKALVSNLALSGTIKLYAKWQKVTVSVLIQGDQFNNRMKTLAGSLNNIEKVKFSTDIPDSAIENYGTHRVSISTRSDEATYMWWDSTSKTLYYGSNADIIYLNESAYKMFQGMNNVTEIDTHFDTSKVESFEQMFNNDYKLETLDVSHFNTSSATTLQSMFTQCRSMTSYNINGWDVSKVKYFNHMFNSNWKLQSLDISNWHTDAAVNMRNMFSSTFEMAILKLGSGFDTSHVENLHGFINDNPVIERLDISMFNTQSLKDFSGFVQNDTSLTEIIFPATMNMSKVTNTSKMFQNVSALETLDISMFNMSKVTTIGNMFDDMASIKTIYVGAGWNLAAMSSGSNPQMFYKDENLEGGLGTKYTDMPSDKATMKYAKIDDPDHGNPGYFTSKN